MLHIYTFTNKRNGIPYVSHTQTKKLRIIDGSRAMNPDMPARKRSPAFARHRAVVSNLRNARLSVSPLRTAQGQLPLHSGI